MNIKCKYCGKIFNRFLSQIKKNNFCSIKCRGRWQSENITGVLASNYRGGKYLKCAICNKDIYRKPSAIKKINYCSKKCLDIGKRNSVKIQCNNCNKIFEKPKSYLYWHAKRKHKYHFCSKKCMLKYFSGTTHPLWIKNRKKLKNRLKSIRWSKKMCNARKKVYKRDNYTCQECGKTNTVLNAHHIKRFVDNEKKRFDINNMITLCEKCHKKTFKTEKFFEKRYKKKLGVV